MKKGLIIGVLGTIVIGLAAAYFFITLGFMPVNADAPPPKLEKWMARKSLRAALKRAVVERPNPVPLNEDNFIAGIKLYAANCWVCHGAVDGAASNIAQGLYQKAPQLAKHGVEDDSEAKIYWIIEHGIRLTGMPSFKKTLSENEIWQITLFLKHMDSLSPKAAQVWQALSSAAASSSSQMQPGGEEEPHHHHDH